MRVLGVILTINTPDTVRSRNAFTISRCTLFDLMKDQCVPRAREGKEGHVQSPRRKTIDCPRGYIYKLGPSRWIAGIPSGLFLGSSAAFRLHHTAWALWVANEADSRWSMVNRLLYLPLPTCLLFLQNSVILQFDKIRRRI